MGQSIANSNMPTEPRYVPELNEGDNVRHQLFGDGTVLEIDVIILQYILKVGVQKS